MTVAPINNPIQKYRTVKILSEFSADAIRGRGTRVFEAYEINEDGQRVQGSKNVAIKDYWLDSSREAEPTILKKILEGADESMKAKFLTVLAWGNISIDGNVDSTDRITNDLKVGPRGYTDSDHPNALKFYLCQYQPKGPSKRAAPGLAPSTGSRLTLSVARFDSKTHQRIVFKEVGHPIYDENSITTVFKAARDAAEGQCKQSDLRAKPSNNSLALEFMSKKEYVHRDVSSGNILIVDGKGKLSDLEYAQIIGTGGRHGVRTVCHHFLHFLTAYSSYI